MLNYNAFATKAMATSTKSSGAEVVFESYPKLGQRCQFLIKINHEMHNCEEKETGLKW